MLNAVRIWILFSTLLVASGWVLSALHELNRVGYEIIFALAAIALIFLQCKAGWRPQKNMRQLFAKFQRRFRRPAPLIFLILLILSFVSGCLYEPYNSDTDAYRLPRVLHWLGQGQWHWIHTADMRMNVSSCGFEWLATPVIVFTKSFRALFLINWISYLMLPGLVYAVFIRLGVRRRVAWWWMWILASGWCYVLQAASVANDSFMAVYALASLTLAMKSKEAHNKMDFWLSLLAISLLTGTKQTVLPLTALWLVAAFPQWRLLLKKPITFLIVASIGLLVSVAPTIFFNFKYTGSWSGLSAISNEYPNWHIQLDSPFWGIIGNLFCVSVQNLLPPFFPWSSTWNHEMHAFVISSFGAHFRSFENFGKTSPGISESSAGIGLAVVLVAVISICIARRFKSSSEKKTRLQTTLRLLPWGLLLIFMAKVGEAENARHLASYYVFFFPSFLVATGHKKLVRQTWWKWMALSCMLSAIGLLILNTNRPLFPAMTITSHEIAKHPQSKILSVLHAAYEAQYSLKNANEQVEERLPDDGSVVGYAVYGNGQLEPGLWMPLGSRQVERVLKNDAPLELRHRGIHYVVIEDRPYASCDDVKDWLARYNAALIADFAFQKTGSSGNLSPVYIVRLNE